MIAPALTLTALLVAPPGDSRPPVQTPSVTPTQPQPGEPAIAPAHVDAEREAMGPEAMGPEAEPQPQPLGPQPLGPEPDAGEGPAEPTSPAGGLPSWEAEPIQPVDSDVSGPVVVDDWGLPVAPPVKRLPPKGGGLYAAAGALFGIMITRQWATAISCDDVYCGWRGNYDRILSLGVMGLSAGGGWLDGRRADFIRRDAGEPSVVPRGRRIAGWTVFGLGLAGLITDTVLYNLCYEQALGPYTQITGFRYTCSPVASVVVVDFSTAVGSVGIALGTSAEAMGPRKPKKTIGLVPWGGQGRAGLSLSGRF